MAKRSIVVNQKQYFLPDHIDTQAYLDYCDVQDALDSATNYRRKHFEQMAHAVCHVYGDQFTLDDVLAPVYGLEPSQILTEFAALEFYVMERVNKSVETITVNFTKEA